MAEPKTRLTDNFHCFEGAGHSFWKAVAQGMRPTGLTPSPDGYTLDYAGEHATGDTLERRLAPL